MRYSPIVCSALLMVAGCAAPERPTPAPEPDVTFWSFPCLIATEEARARIAEQCDALATSGDPQP
ncbi:hypothetical protein [Albimonas pacifica]|uniref:hypothetical protein n=1 Tax=Albimonas pacifica TaxID=1114924 RepID=UPI001160B7DB|nr:hypothetical protein [Albimonas pacifica]